MLLALLRTATLAVLLLLLFDPLLPTAARTTSVGTIVILDGSISMELPVTAGTTRWNDAVERARRVPNASTVLIAGEVPRRVTKDSLSALAPDGWLVPHVARTAGSQRKRRE